MCQNDQNDNAGIVADRIYRSVDGHWYSSLESPTKTRETCEIFTNLTT